MSYRFLYVFFISFYCSVHSQSGYNYYKDSDKIPFYRTSFDKQEACWIDNSNSIKSRGWIKGGAFYWESTDSIMGRPKTCLIPFDSERDYQIETTFTVLKNKYNFDSHGIVLTETKPYKSFGFYITKNGSYTILRYENSQATFIKNNSYSTAIRKSGFNTLTVRKVGQKNYYYINKQLVHTSSAIPFKNAKIGFNTGALAKIAVTRLDMHYIGTRKTKESPYAYREDYNGNKTIQGPSYINRYISNGWLHYESKNSKSYSFTKLVPAFYPDKDFELVARIKIHSGAPTKVNDLMFGENGKFYSFGFTNNQYFIISQQNGSGTRKIKDFTKESAIRKNGFNTLMIRRRSRYMQFFINDVLVHSARDLTISGNSLGVGVASNSAIKVDYIYLKKLPKRPAIYADYRGSDKKTLFYENFNSNSKKWPTVSDQSMVGYISNGAYTLKSLTSQTTSVHRTVQIPTNKNFEIEASIAFVSGSENMGMQLIWGQKYSETGLYNFNFIITNNQFYSIGKQLGTKIEVIKDWTQYNGIRPNEFNKLTIRKVGKTYHFFINEVGLFKMPFQPFYGDEISFSSPPNSTIKVTGLRVYELK